MKKIYIKPETKVTNVALQQMIAVSVTLSDEIINNQGAKDQLDLLDDWEF